jgi:DNA-directed RNA polymerase subunit RPC12/RpoP
MSGVRTFFRHCPSCGRRFEVRLVRKEAVGEQDLSETEERIRAPFIAPAPTLMTEDAPVVVNIEEFQYTYKCKHCGHEWSEVQDTERKFEAPKGYTGD